MAHARERSERSSELRRPSVQPRLRGFLSFVLILMSVISLKLVYIQVIRRGHYMELDGQVHRGPAPDVPVPGGIYARGMEPMAVSVPMASVCVNPVQIARGTLGIEATARRIAELAGLDAIEVRGIIERGVRNKSKFAYVARLLQPEQTAALSDAGLQGVWASREYKRVYPGGRLAAHILGRTSRYHEPLDGIELRWSFLLAGKPGTRPRNQDTYGRSILGADAGGVLAPESGRNLVLTIDWQLQQVVEMAMDDLVKRNRPKAATAVVMDPSTGEILAMTSRPNFDPASIGSGSAEEIAARLKDLPVVRQYEPGSLFKVLLTAALLESPAYRNQTFYCGGATHLGGRALRCWDPRGHGATDVARMLAKSCNIAAAHFALVIGREHYRDFLTSVGIGHRTGIGMPGEATGSLRPADALRERDLANLGFGQGVSVTDLQMLNAVCAVVNGGHLMYPQIVKAVFDAETGQPVRQLEPLEVRRVCSQQTSARVRELMRGVVEDGTGASAAIEGVAVGGKTGTAQKWVGEEGGFIVGRNIMSFVMIAPADRPRFAILVTADEPAIGEHGSDVAAPTAKTIAVAALRQAGLLPEQAEIREGVGI